MRIPRYKIVCTILLVSPYCLGASSFMETIVFTTHDGETQELPVSKIGMDYFATMMTDDLGKHVLTRSFIEMLRIPPELATKAIAHIENRLNKLKARRQQILQQHNRDNGHTLPINQAPFDINRLLNEQMELDFKSLEKIIGQSNMQNFKHWLLHSGNVGYGQVIEPPQDWLDEMEKNAVETPSQFSSQIFKAGESKGDNK